jgi:hypothetical protein
MTRLINKNLIIFVDGTFVAVRAEEDESRRGFSGRQRQTSTRRRIACLL